MFKKLLLFLAIHNAYNTVECLKVLAIFPHPSLSHVNVFLPIMKGLAEKGHEVTVLSNFHLPEIPPNYKELHFDKKENLAGHIELNYFNGYRIEKYLNGVLLAYFGYNTCEFALNSTATRNLMNSKEKYDLLIVEMFNMDCFLPFAQIFQVPVIGLSSCTMLPWTYERFGQPNHPAYIPQNHFDFSDEMTLIERVENSIFYVLHDFLFNKVMRWMDQRAIIKYFGDKVPDLNDIIYNSSLILVNSHFSLNLPYPSVPNVIEVGGVHVAGKEIKRLPPDLEEFVNKSEHGVIYFSMGSMIRGESFPEAKRQEFLKAFARLPQRVLWKYESEMPGKPDNVMIKKWMPQLDILCHPNVVAYIAHGGLLGMTEAVHCGVPVVVMPIFGDQHTNARALEKSGGGVILQLREANEESVYNALQKVLDLNFRKGAKELSERFRDRPLSPLDTAIYWVEYVARHRGAHHMRTAAVGMPFYQYYLLDVIAFIVVILGLIFVINFYIIRGIIRLLFKTNKNVKAKTKIN